MNNYGNVNGGSNVTGYESGAVDLSPYIKVQFADGSVYEYTEQSCGAGVVFEMQRLAAAGVGLNGFISKNRPQYASKS